MISKRIAEKIVRKVFKNAEIVKLSLYKQGIINKNYEITTIRPKKEFILRLYPKDGWKAEKEGYVYGLISRHAHIPIPNIYLKDESKTLLPVSYALLLKIKGIELDKAYKKTKNKNLLITAGEYLAKIHSIKLQSFGWIMRKGISPSFDKWNDFLLYDLNDKLSNLVNIKAFPQEIVKKSRIFFMEKCRLLEIKDKPSLLHKDYHFSHILSDGKKITGIIDVEWAIAGHNELDLTKSIMWMSNTLPEFEEPFMYGYRKFGRLSKSFYIRKPVYEFLVLISSLSLAYEYHNMKWVKRHLNRLKEIVK